jgi:hypothetical protein
VIQTLPDLAFYTITVNPPADTKQGKAISNYERASVSTPVQLLASPSAGFAFTGWSFSGSGVDTGLLDLTSNPLTFIMPAANVSVTPVFAASSYFTVTVDLPQSSPGGTVALDPPAAASGILPDVWVGATAAPSAGWIFVRWDVENLSGFSADQLKQPSLSFQMPAANVILTPVFAQLFKITIDKTAAPGFSISGDANGEKAIAEGVAAGTPITFTATNTNAAYQWKSWTSSPAVTDTDLSTPLTFTFAMPADNVTITPASSPLTGEIDNGASPGDWSDNNLENEL